MWIKELVLRGKEVLYYCFPLFSQIAVVNQVPRSVFQSLAYDYIRHDNNSRYCEYDE